MAFMASSKSILPRSERRNGPIKGSSPPSLKKKKRKKKKTMFTLKKKYMINWMVKLREYI